MTGRLVCSGSHLRPVTVSACVSVSWCLCQCWPVPVSTCVSVSLCQCQLVSVSVCPCDLCQCQSVSAWVSVWMSVSACVGVSLSVSVSLCQLECQCECECQCQPVCVSLSISVGVSVSLCLWSWYPACTLCTRQIILLCPCLEDAMARTYMTCLFCVCDWSNFLTWFWYLCRVSPQVWEKRGVSVVGWTVNSIQEKNHFKYLLKLPFMSDQVSWHKSAPEQKV